MPVTLVRLQRVIKDPHLSVLDLKDCLIFAIIHPEVVSSLILSDNLLLNPYLSFLPPQF